VVILSSSNLMIDESLLTGESVPVRKIDWDNKTKITRPGGEDLPFAYSSTLVSQGHAIAKVIGTAKNTEVGKIGHALKTIAPEKTELQKETDRLIKFFAIFGFATCAIVIVFYGFTHVDWTEGVLAGLALAMSMMPEEFPVVLTIFLALGAWRMSKHGVLTRRMNAIQNLGATTVLCTDKTGTLTENNMTLVRIWSQSKTATIGMNKKLDSWAHKTLEYSALASQKQPYDPMERSIKQCAQKMLPENKQIQPKWELVREYPLTTKILATTNVWSMGSDKNYTVACKGAPEAVMKLCKVKNTQKKQIMKQITDFSSQGLRILGVAGTRFSAKKLPDSQQEFDFEFIGLIALQDPVRLEVPNAVKECYQAGMRVIMITGDYALTAKVVAKNCGFLDYENVISGEQIEKLSDKELRSKIRNTNVFARVVPEQKLRIVEALKANNEIVVMTGDGVNDAPALKASAVGIAMGGRGTDVARESASLVLTDDNFTSIVSAVRMGRRIYDNIKKAMGYIIAVHIPIAGISLVPVLAGWPIVLYPVHIAFLELIIDPVCSVVFEAEKEEKNIMTRKPRKKDEKLFDNKMIASSALRGFILMLAVVGIYAFSLNSGIEENTARAMTFSTLIIGNLALILASRSQTQTIYETLASENKALLAVIAFALIFLTLALFVPFLQNLFKFSQVSVEQIGICIVACILSMIAFEVSKWKMYHTKNTTASVKGVCRT
jgi:Ca2+-transporting ATPase